MSLTEDESLMSHNMLSSPIAIAAVASLIFFTLYHIITTLKPGASKRLKELPGPKGTTN
jgi:hypothetical protein